ncbi:hypothetical protein A1F96_06673 [Pyrenophora tritici-repentis]|uniref:Uncharacterized protein n=1 Tax=Pyrenophora tritici-repentis (strain Pt-1C-BFP) TaxID=426418 RepID=B2WD77_PYRTR|nr:uncharacterized protein PTRG_07936 [Pyrenophora tritici-repentis Pt-1C-BFP]EDU50855.1 predicted protein [Pyrenophora tritici-repentis Pt-1C-BFP]KAI1537210.1 hypothetical protein PtrSN001A_005365 [Pyrenophora tritici-repentis]PZD27501.1 hypothetical protein A1F96_06673 [Pyrenophora tritici-repentis]
MHLLSLLLPLIALKVSATDSKNEIGFDYFIPFQPPCIPRRFWIDCTEIEPGKWIPAEEPMTNIPFVEKRNCQYEWGVSAWVPFNNGKLGNIGCFYEKIMRKVVIDYTSSCCPPPWKEDIESEEQSIINSLDAGFDPESDLNDDIYSGGGWSVDTSTWESLHQK